MSEVKLLPCPFCGGEPREVVGLVGCEPCGFGMSGAEKWNTRHAPEGWQCVPAKWPEGMARRLSANIGQRDALMMWALWPEALKAAPSPGQEK